MATPKSVKANKAKRDAARENKRAQRERDASSDGMTTSERAMAKPSGRKVASGHAIAMSIGKECKGSIRYESSDPDAVVSNVYLSRNAFDPMPDRIVVTVAEGGA